MYVSRSASLQVYYTRAFITDLKNLEYATREHIYEIVFEKFKRLDRFRDLPELQQLGAGGIFYRFSVGNCFVAVELTGNIVKFLRVLPKPDI